MRVQIGTLTPGTRIILSETMLDGSGVVKKVGRYKVGKSSQFRSGRPCVQVLTNGGKKIYTLVDPSTEVVA